jgi:hypothetical protein
MARGTYKRVFYVTRVRAGGGFDVTIGSRPKGESWRFQDFDMAREAMFDIIDGNERRWSAFKV